MPTYRLGNLAPTLDPESWIAPNAVVIADVEMAKNSSVWWNCTVRGDTDKIIIGENSNIQDGSHQSRHRRPHRQGRHRRPHGHAARLHHRR